MTTASASAAPAPSFLPTLTLTTALVPPNPPSPIALTLPYVGSISRLPLVPTIPEEESGQTQDPKPSTTGTASTMDATVTSSSSESCPPIQAPLASVAASTGNSEKIGQNHTPAKSSKRANLGPAIVGKGLTEK